MKYKPFDKTSHKNITFTENFKFCTRCAQNILYIVYPLMYIRHNIVFFNIWKFLGDMPKDNLINFMLILYLDLYKMSRKILRQIPTFLENNRSSSFYKRDAKHLHKAPLLSLYSFLFCSPL